MGFMCFGSSKQDDPRARKNADIEKQLRADQKKQAKEVKILLLGASPYTHTTKQAEMLTCDLRCRRERQVDSAEANAPDPHQGFLAERT